MIDRKTMGARIRELRVRRKMTLKAAEQASGLSSTHLSEIERGRTSPTIGALLRVAGALEVDPCTFIEETARGPFVLTEGNEPGTAGNRDPSNRPMPGVAGGQMTVVRLRLPKRARYEIEEDCEAVGFVLEGSVALVLDVERRVLERGDSFHDLSLGSRAIVNDTDGVARLRLVLRRCGPH
jgi:transcriptional regulator with XRE-family HTH domain